MSTTNMILVCIAVAAVATAVAMYLRAQRTVRLRSRYGPEYERAVQEAGSARRAEALLEKREKRVSRYQIRPLSSAECARRAADWRTVQERFVDDPNQAVEQADVLVHEVMKARGYPVSGFAEEAADLSVDHPRVVEHYRAAHQVALRADRGEASTEELRLAMQHYRKLFEELLGTPVAGEAHLTSRS